MAVSQTIATIPPAPSRADPANFVERHEAVLDRLETLPPEMNTWKDQVNTTQSAINASELQAGQSATTATNAASLALSYSNAEQYAAGTTYDPGETVIGSNGTAYRRLNTSAAGDNPVTSTTGNWTPAITALGAMSTFDLICRIAGMQPTLYLNAKEQDYRIYSPSTGLTRKALADIVTTERASDGPIWTPQGKLVQLTDDAPRVTFDPETGVGEGLLVEESRTNLLTYSEQFDNADWVKTRSTVAANVAIAPDGTLTADKLVEDTSASASHYLTETFSRAIGTLQTFSLFVKAGERSSVEIQMNNTGGSPYPRISFDLPTVTVGPLGVYTDAGIEDVGGGWYRVYAIGEASETSGAANVFLRNSSSVAYTGDGTSGLYIWGAQLEEGAFPTSYIPTTTAAATRAADVASITGTTFSDFYRQDEFTILYSPKNVPTGPGLTRMLFEITDGDDNDRIVMYGRGSDGTLRLAISDSGVSQAFGDCGAYINDPFAMSASSDSCRVFVGGVGVLDISGGNMPLVDRLIIGGSVTSSTAQMNGAMGLYVFFSKRLPDATLQQLSTLVI